MSTREARITAWERRERPVFAVLPYTLLVVATVMDVLLGEKPARSLLVDVAVAAGTGLWMLCMFTLRPQWRSRRWPTGVFFVGLVVLMAALALRSPLFGFFTFTGYFYAYALPAGLPRAAGVVAVAVVTATAQSGGAPRAEPGALTAWAVIVLVNVGVAGAVSWFAWIGEEQKTRLERVVAELVEANRRLEESLRENEGLHVQLLVQAREAGMLDERARLAREIHDTLAQGLAGIITQLQAAEQADAAAASRRRHLEAAAGLARESLSEARRSVQALRPEALERARLPEALADVADRWTGLHGVPAHVATTGSARALRPEIEVTLLRTAQEALANVAKHAGATRVGLTLSYMEDVVTLDVRDDGVGFAPGSAEADGASRPGSPTRAAGATDGFGLAAMRQRIAGLAGTLAVESEPGTGTAVSATVPAVPAGSNA